VFELREPDKEGRRQFVLRVPPRLLLKYPLRMALPPPRF
jgi:hypothetical protein